MEFINKLVEEEGSVSYSNVERRGRPRQFKAIEIGDLVLSIQASFNHYCKPRETLDINELYCYDRWEIAIFSKDNWMHPSDDFFNNFSRVGELCKVYENPPYPVGAYVPTDLIEDLLDYIKNNKKNT